MLGISACDSRLPENGMLPHALSKLQHHCNLNCLSKA